MEVKNMGGKINTNEKEEYDDVPLPGFRFHPTDEELVGFYLQRKVEKRPVTIEHIKQADIYKYDPWDLPKSSSLEDQKERYFFCKRGRKYKNSIRPNRVTGSGFWKATGIDRPIYEGRNCIGLKKSLVYYRGSAGKGTKTEWMMHEFRLPPPAPGTAKTNNVQMDGTTIAQEAEVWTLCRILQRNIPCKKLESRRGIEGNANVTNKGIECCEQNIAQRRYISFQQKHEMEKKFFSSSSHVLQSNTANHQFEGYFSTSTISEASSYSYSTDISEELLTHADWEDLRSILNCTESVVMN